MDENCGNCRYRLNTRCHRNAPQALLLNGYTQDEPITGWPKVATTDWCGEWKILAELNDQCEHIQELEDENAKLKRQVKLATDSAWVHYYEMGDYYVCTFCGETAQYEHDLKHHTDCVIK